MVLPQPIRFVARLRETFRRPHGVDEEERHLMSEEPPSPQSPNYPLLLSLLGGGDSSTIDSDVPPCEGYIRLVQELRSSLPPTHSWLNPVDVRITHAHPVAAGGFADILEGALLDGRKIILKSYRCYVVFDHAQVISRYYKELHMCNLLSHRNIVPFVGGWSTEVHPFSLVYEWMGNLDLRQYLQNEPNAPGTTLLTGIARGLEYLHGLDIVHGNLQTVNIVVETDGTVRIAGLGSASTLLDTPDAPTKADDILAFGIVAWEICSRTPPFSGMTEVAAARLMLGGIRLPRPDQVSNQVWGLIERCWRVVPSKRMLAGEAVDLLEAELHRISANS